MRTLYIECNMGAAGDMLMAALLELLPHPDPFMDRMNGLGIPGVRIERTETVKCGVTGTHIAVRVGGEEEGSRDVPAGHAHEHRHEQGHGHRHDHGHDHEHDHHKHRHTGMAEIHKLLNGLPISGRVRSDALAVYGLIAEAESKVHGKPVDVIHFHEVGMMDALADIVGACLLMEELAPQRVVVSPVHVGSGQVRCAHGILPVPAPATAHILRGVPTYGGEIRGELCTPTGAALLKHFADEFGDRPVMITEAVGYGMGKKDFPAANCVRVFLGETRRRDGDIVELACNLDDITGEELGFARETLMENGALDVYVVPIQMKKGRPGHMLVCLCRPDDEEKMIYLMLRHTTTLGVRGSHWRRHTLERSVETLQTELGAVRVKTGSGFGIVKNKPEYEDLAELARKHGWSVAEVRKAIKGLCE